MSVINYISKSSKINSDLRQNTVSFIYTICKKENIPIHAFVKAIHYMDKYLSKHYTEIDKYILSDVELIVNRVGMVALYVASNINFDILSEYEYHKLENYENIEKKMLDIAIQKTSADYLEKLIKKKKQIFKNAARSILANKMHNFNTQLYNYPKKLANMVYRDVKNINTTNSPQSPIGSPILKNGNITRLPQKQLKGQVERIIPSGTSDTILFQIGNGIIKYPQDSVDLKKEIAIYTRIIPYIKKATPFVLSGKRMMINLDLFAQAGNKIINNYDSRMIFRKLNLKGKKLLFVTEYIDRSQTLYSLLKENNISQEDKKGIVFQIMWTLYIFSLVGLRHFDLHTDNILVRKQKTNNKFIMHDNTILVLPTEWFNYRIFIFDFDKSHQKLGKSFIMGGKYSHILFNNTTNKNKIKIQNHNNNKNTHFYYQDVFKIISILKTFDGFEFLRRPLTLKLLKYGYTFKPQGNNKNHFVLQSPSFLKNTLVRNGYQKLNKKNLNTFISLTPEIIIRDMYKKYIQKSPIKGKAYNARGLSL